MTLGSLCRMGLAAGVAALACGAWVAAQGPSAGIEIDADDIGGVVTSAKGPEAGVWLIAETTDLPTKFARIVVTDDRGRYVLPDLPKANYRVWVRGYGLVDSQPVTAAPGKPLGLTASVAPSPRAAAQYYPSNYWLSLLKFPSPTQFPGTGAQGNGIPTSFKTQADWVDAAKGCLNCHQIGNKATREIPETLGKFASPAEAWDHRMKVGQAGAFMSASFTRLGRERAISVFSDWTNRIAAGEIPQAPPRPQGVERNVVVSMWDWGNTPTEFVHDQIVTDKRNPRVNANGPAYGVGSGSDSFVWVDPNENKAYSVKLPTSNPKITGPLGSAVQVPSAYWGDELYWHNPAYPHNPMMDQKGRLWITATIRDPQKQPDFCKEGSPNKFAQVMPINRSGKQLEVFDPKTKQFEQIDTCFSTHHLEFAADKDNTLFFSNVGGVPDAVGWVNTRVWDETHDAQAAQAWCPAVLDTNGDGKITKGWTEPDQPVDPKKDHRVQIPCYGNAVNQADGTFWCANSPAITRLDIGNNPPETCKAERYEAPSGTAFYPHGIDFDSNGVAWVNFPSSGHFASFDRRKCKVLNGPSATGQHCPEGWTFYRLPGPMMQEPKNVSADWTYVVWVDRFNTLGLGENVPMTHGTNSDALYAFLPQTKEWVTLRVPYPLTFYPRLNDGRIDDPNAGWKGRGVWANYGNTNNWHIEGGKTTRSKIVKLQMRPNPLAH
jgi:hypothetical protein